MRTLIVLAATSFSLAAWAQQEPPSRRVTVMDLEGDLIEGTSDRPDLEAVTASPEARDHGSLIRIRQDFRDRAMQSVSGL